MLWVWRWLPLVVALAATTALPVPDETDTSTKLLGSSVVTSVSVVMGHEDGAQEKSDTRKATEDLPPSTVDMLKPDGFQFYTVDEKGQLITRQMTDSEIQSIIAAGGGPFPMETQDPQKTGDNMMGEIKVADVVQNVKKVLKDELNKPAPAMGTVPTIPGHANDEWSSILPSILGGEAESAPVTLPETDITPTKEIVKQNVSAPETSIENSPVPEAPERKPQESESPDTNKTKPTVEETKNDEMAKIEQKQRPENTEKPAQTEQAPPKKPQENSERPMVQVPVITADSVQSTMKDPSIETEKPVYQILNTISAEEVKDKDAQNSGAPKPADAESEKTETPAIPEKEFSDSGISSAAEKTEGEVKKPEVVEEVPTTSTATVETVVEMDISSSFVPSVQGESDVSEASSAPKETEDTKPAVDAQKLETPSITLEAPVVGEKPVDPVIKSEEKEPQVIPEVKPAAAEKDEAEKKPAVVQEAPNAPTLQTEAITPQSVTIEEEVSEIVNLIPESISSIVDELISESANVLPDEQVKSEAPEASLADNDTKKPETPATNDATKIQDSDDKTDDSSSLVSTEPGSPDDKVTPTVASDAKLPETDAEPIFEMMPEISPESSITKITASSGAVENNPEESKIVPEEMISGDKIEQQIGTNAQSESPQNMIPVVDAVTDNKDDSKTETTQTTVEKKPETLLTELADSVSSMISQVSEIMPSMVPIPQKTETSEPPVKRVEDGVKTEEASTVRSEVLPAMVAIASDESAKPLVTDVESPPEKEMTKPEKTESEIVMVEVKTPQPTTIGSNLDAPDTTKISEPVSTDPITKTGDKIESSEIQTASEPSSDSKKTEAPASEDEKIEQVEATPADSGATKISASSSDQEPVKSEATLTLKPEDLKPEKTEDVAKGETKTEAISPDVEAPIVRIDISEAKPTDSGVKNSDSTESSVVRIQLTNTVSTINQMIDSAPEANPAVEVEDISLPEKTVLEASSPQNIGSGLIAGAQPSNVIEIKTPENLPQPETAAPASNEVLENPNPAETANGESDTKTEFKPDAESSSDDKPLQPEIERTKIPEAQVTQETIQSQPEVNNENNNKPQTPETEILKPTEAADESKLKKPVETEILKGTPASVEKGALPVESMVKIDPPVIGDEKVESPMKSKDQEKPTQTPGKIVEPVTVISEEKIEQTDVPKPVKNVEKPTEVPEVQKTETVVPPEVVVSTTVEVEVEPTKESPETVKVNAAEPIKSEKKPEETNVSKIAPESIGTLENVEEKKPEADNNVAKINQATSESNENLVPVQLASPAAAEPEVQPPDQVPEVSTIASASEGKKPGESGAQKEQEAPTTAAQADSEIPNAESTEKKTEQPDVKNEAQAQVEGANASEAVKETSDSVENPEVVKIEDSKFPSGVDRPENNIPIATSPTQTDVKESSVTDVSEKDQTPVPLVRIDVSPEKIQTENSTIKIKESHDEVVTDDKKAEKPAETLAQTEINLSGADQSLKETDKPEEGSASAVETPSAQSVKPETIVSTSESSSKAPVEEVGEEPKVQIPGVKEPEVVKVNEEGVKETIDIVHSELPGVTATVQTASSASPTVTKIENEETAKPGIRIDTTSHDAENNTPVKTQEVRIQVNDTAVLVTKQQIPQKAENDDEKVRPTGIPDSIINRIETSSQTAEKIETTSQQPDEIQVPGQQPDKIQVPSQQPEKVELLSQPIKTPSVKPEKVEVLSQPTKMPSVEKPAPVTSAQQADKTTLKQDEDKVQVEKKPVIDPYVKLGEKKPEQKPVDRNTTKLPISGNKRPSNTVANKDSADKWTLISQGEPNPVIKPQVKPPGEEPSSANKNEDVSVPLEAHKSAVSLDESTRHQDEDISNFSKLCNELAFSFWVAANKGLSTGRSLALSPFGMTSMLAMVFLGARGPTSGQMNDILKLDDVVTFNPHLVFQNVSDSVNLARGQGIANAAFVRELFADRIKAGRLLPFYKERAQQFYDGHVEEVNFATISDLVRRRTNLLIRRQTGGRIRDFVKGNVMPLRSPLAALSANVFQTDCTGASSEGRDGEMYFAVLPAVRQRKLVPVPATVWRSGVLAGYEPGLDATVVSLGGVGNLVSTIFVLPGQQGLAAPGDSLDHLERRLLEGAFTNGVWDRLIRVLIPRMGLEVQVPKFSHRSVVNATAALKRMGLDDLFSRHADLKGINGVGNDLHLADMLQINLFSTCGDEVITGGRHHVEIYPATPLRGARVEKKTTENEKREEDVDEAKEEEKEAKEEEEKEEEEEEKKTRISLNVGEYVQRSHDLEKRSTSLGADKQLIEEDQEEEERSQRSSSNSKELLQLSKGKQNERPLLKLDRPFLYFVRHNPTGMILHMGRFNPRLMP